MNVILVSAALAATLFAVAAPGQASLDTLVDRANSIAHLQRIMNRIMSIDNLEGEGRRVYTPVFPRFRPSYRIGASVRPLVRSQINDVVSDGVERKHHHKHHHHHHHHDRRNKSPVVNVNIRVPQKADKKKVIKGGMISVLQKDYRKGAEGELEAHWHTQKKEILINGNTNMTRIETFVDDGEIKKSVGKERAYKIRSLKAGKVKGKKLVQSVFSPRHYLNRTPEEKAKREQRKKQRKEQEKKEAKAFHRMVRKLMQPMRPASIDAIDAQPAAATVVTTAQAAADPAPAKA